MFFYASHRTSYVHFRLNAIFPLSLTLLPRIEAISSGRAGAVAVCCFLTLKLSFWHSSLMQRVLITALTLVDHSIFKSLSLPYTDLHSRTFTFYSRQLLVMRDSVGRYIVALSLPYLRSPITLLIPLISLAISREQRK